MKLLARRGFASLAVGQLVSIAGDRFHYLATRDQDIYVVQEQLK